MANRKKVTSKVTTTEQGEGGPLLEAPPDQVVAEEAKDDPSNLSFFACDAFIKELQMSAEDNDGELSEEQIGALVAAQTQLPAKLLSLCNFLSMMESKEKIIKDRISELQEAKQRCADLMGRLKRPLAAWVDEQGKSYHVGEYTLKTRKSTSVELPEGFNDPLWCNFETVTMCKPDKVGIKKALADGEKVEGCKLIVKSNLSIK